MSAASTGRTVSVIVPCRNEADHIEAFCRSVAAQQVPEGWQLQVLIADGLSDDGTRKKLQAFCRRDPRFVMIDNPGRIVSCGLNRCIEQAAGEFIVRLDVHTVYASDYVAQCLATWQATGADNVGGPWKAEGQSGAAGVVQRAVAAAFQSKLVAGGALSRDLAHNGWVDTVYLGAWPKATFARFGGFDETLVRNQDDEHNLRIHQGVGKVWQSASIRSTYFPRASKMDVFRQYRQYGYWKPFVMRKHGQPAALRHLIPGLFVLALLASLLALPWSGWPLAALLAAYAGVLLLASASLAGQGAGVLLRAPAVIATYHLAYGLGSVLGWIDVLRGVPPEAARRSRFARLTR